MQCKTCGELMEGDGYTVVVHCPNAAEESHWDKEPDAAPVFCDENPFRGEYERLLRVRREAFKYYTYD